MATTAPSSPGHVFSVGYRWWACGLCRVAAAVGTRLVNLTTANEILAAARLMERTHADGYTDATLVLLADELAP